MVQKAKEYRKTLHTLKAEVLVINKFGPQQTRKMPITISKIVQKIVILPPIPFIDATNKWLS